MAITTFGQVNTALNISSKQQNILCNNNVQTTGIDFVGDMRMMRCNLGLQEFHSIGGVQINVQIIIMQVMVW